MLDVAIAANFVRELTEEQFVEQRRSGPRGATEQQRNGSRGVVEQRRHASRGTTEQRRNGSRGVVEQPRHAGRGAAATRSVNGSGPAPESGRSEPAPRSRTRNETTGLRRALARFAQVRG